MQNTSNIYTVSGLAAEVRNLLEGTYPFVTVEGEISNLVRPASGHLYFTLKDSGCQIRCAMFRGQNRRLRFAPADGAQVLARGTVSLYTPRGDFQLIVAQMEEAGEGALRRAFEALKAKLADEGLFAPELKRPLPLFPHRVGVITSPSGAAVRDILSVMGRRFPSIPVLVYPTQVQGATAPAEIVNALRLADRIRECDILILARGGGSLEDLQAFNDEAVARAIAECGLPIVTGIGHEVDITIADFVADRRAETPSAAAAATVPNRDDWSQTVQQHALRLEQTMRRQLSQERQRSEWMTKRLRHPRQGLRDQAQRLDGLAIRLAGAGAGLLGHSRHRLDRLTLRLGNAQPDKRLPICESQLQSLSQRLRAVWRRQQDGRRAAVAGFGRALDAVSPLATLSRGYAILSRDEDGQVVRKVADAPPGTRLRARVADGILVCTSETDP